MSPAYHIAVLADIHGNLPALEAVLADLQRDQPLDAILVAGDMIAGPDQALVLQQLINLNAVMIQGNNEQAILRIAAGTAPPYVLTTHQYSLRRWAAAHLSADHRERISRLPEQTVFTLPGADPIRLAHGSPRNINELVIPDSQLDWLRNIMKIYPEYIPPPITEIFNLVREPIILLGHAHLPWSERQKDRLMLNPGAVNFPENGWIGAQYALLHWQADRWTPEFRAIRYDMQAFRQSNQESGFLSTGILAQIFMEEVTSGRDIASDFLLLARQLANQAGCAHLPYFPDEIWDQAVREFSFP